MKVQKLMRSAATMKTISLSLVVAAALSLVGCASTGNQQTASDDPHAVNDPWEGYNRKVFAFNDALDQAVGKPVVKGYRAVLPQGVRNGVHNFLSNLNSPVNLANQLLQGDLKGAGNVVFRTTVNTLTGFGGVLDNAAAEGWEPEKEDFGQTLAVWGAGSGPYLVLPVLGPSTVRDTIGLVADTYMDPLRWYLFNTHNEEWYYGEVVMIGVDTRDQVYDALNDLRTNSIDYYAAVRSAYLQHRSAMINDQDAGAEQAPAIPDYDDMDDY